MSDSDNDPDDDLELELEPVDPNILEMERQRVRDKARDALRAAEIVSTYDDDSQHLEFDVDWIRQFRFTTRHLLITTALLSVLMAVLNVLGGCNTIFLLLVVVVVAGWGAVIWKERRDTEAREKRRAELRARHAAEDASEHRTDRQPLAPTTAEATRQQEAEAYQEPAFDLSFSVKEMFVAFTFAAVLLGLVSFTSDLGTMAILLGSIALAGLAVPAIGFEPPRVVVLSWWLLLVMYLVLGLLAALGVGA